MMVDTMTKDERRLMEAINAIAPNGVNVFKGEHGIAMTNMKTGGWVKNKKGSFVSVEYAKSLNRAQRRKEGIKL